MRLKKQESLHKKIKQNSNQEIYADLKMKNKQRNKERTAYLDIIADSLLLPPDVLHNAPIVTIQGRSALIVENHKKIMEYTDSMIRIQTKQCMISVEGVDLKLAYSTREELKITGIIHTVCYR